MSALDSLFQNLLSRNPTLFKQDGGGGFSGTVATTTSPGIFTPTYGGGRKRSTLKDFQDWLLRGETAKVVQLDKKAPGVRFSRELAGYVGEKESERDPTCSTCRWNSAGLCQLLDPKDNKIHPQGCCDFWNEEDPAKRQEERSHTVEDSGVLREEKEGELKKSYARDRCMECSKSPTTEFLWAEGMAHAWFCDEHAEDFSKREMWHGVSQISSARKLPYGVVSSKWKDGPPSKEESEIVLTKARPGLVPKKVDVEREGKHFTATRWVLPSKPENSNGEPKNVENQPHSLEEQPSDPETDKWVDGENSKLNFPKMEDELSADDKNARYNYANDALSANSINSYLRTGRFEEGGEFRSKDQVDKKIRALDSAIARHKLDHDTIAYRGIDSKYRSPTQNYSDKAYISVTTDRKMLEGMRGYDAILSIKIPAGTGALPNRVESELILPRNSSFAIISTLANKPEKQPPYPLAPFPERVASLEKATPGLIPKRVPVEREGKEYYAVRWVRPSAPESGKAYRTSSGLPIPPGWTDVWVVQDKETPLQAIGRDSKGRRTYLYSTEHSGKATASKFQRLKAFDKALPSILKRVREDLPKEEATLLYLISKTGLRIGSSIETFAAKKAYGASTLQGRHVSIVDDTVRFHFVGKKGVDIRKSVHDPLLAKLLSARKKEARTPLFTATDSDVRSYLKSISGKDFMVKDFRTWIGTQVAWSIIGKMRVPATAKGQKEGKKLIATKVAASLGNTPAVALKSYISPEVFSAWNTRAESFKRIHKSSDSMEEYLAKTVHRGGCSAGQHRHNDYVDGQCHPIEQEHRGVGNTSTEESSSRGGPLTSDSARGFQTRSEGGKWLMDHFLLSDPSREEVEARLAYESPSHRTINARLRGHLKPAPGSPSDKWDRRVIHILDSVLSKRTVPEDVVVYRGGVSRGLFKEGKTFIDRGFVSTSLLEQQALNFVGSGLEDALVEIRVPKGSHAMLGSFGENELILPRGSRFEVTEIIPGTRHEHPRIRLTLLGSSNDE